MPLCQTVPKYLMSQVAPPVSGTLEIWLFCPPPPPPPPTSQHNVQTHISAEVSVIYTTLNWDWPSMAQHSTALLDTAFATYKCMTDYGHLD